jgi:hypothetical protein
MAHKVDIFKSDANGLIWQGTADDLDGAKANVKALRVKSPGDYIIFSQQTGDKIVVKADGSEHSQSTD